MRTYQIVMQAFLGIDPLLLMILVLYWQMCYNIKARSILLLIFIVFSLDFSRHMKK